MKLIRLTDDHYILEVGANFPAQHVLEVQTQFNDWIQTVKEHPTALIINGDQVSYEDRREPDTEKRLKAIERRLKRLERTNAGDPA